MAPATTVAVKAAYLVYAVTFGTDTRTPNLTYFKQPSMEVCQESVKAAKVEVAKSGDAETTVSVFCSETRGSN